MKISFFRNHNLGRRLILICAFSMIVLLYGLALLREQPSLHSHVHSVFDANHDESPVPEKKEDSGMDQETLTRIKAYSARELKKIFDDHDFSLEVCEGNHCIEVPRLETVSLPGDLSRIALTSKKKLFLKTHLPLILRTNEKIIQEREQLLAIIEHREAGFPLGPKDKEFLQELTTKYRLKRIDFKELKKRVDVIPPSLALGQAALESGWGTSFAARTKNSTFGMTVDNRVLSYKDLQNCVDRYVCNMNAHPAYAKMRALRHEKRVAGEKLSSHYLANGLTQYSTKGMAYVRELQHLINSNNLHRYDSAKFMDSQKLNTPHEFS